MPHPEKKRRKLQGRRLRTYDEAADNNSDFQASIESLSGDVLANIYGFLIPVDIMHARLNRKMREAAREAIIPPTYELVVDSAGKCNAMMVMATALPNLPKITLGDLEESAIKYVDGEDPDEDLAARTAGDTAHDIGIISNFTKLRELKIHWSVPLNGRYPCFFNFPHLQILNIRICKTIKFDLEVLAGLPVLKELRCAYTDHLTGNLNNLRVLKNTLEKVEIVNCPSVEGNINSLRVLSKTLENVTIHGCRLVKGYFMDLADFSSLKKLDLGWTAVTGDIRDICENDFPFLEELTLPNGVNGGVEHEFQRISDVTDVIRILYLFQKQRPEVVLKDWYAMLSDDSPDSYEVDEFDKDFVPKYIAFVRAGSRVGYRWENAIDHPCEVNWLDPEPDRESAGYGKYMEELQKIEGQINYFKGFYQPPTQEEFERILERYNDDIDTYDSEMEDN